MFGIQRHRFPHDISYIRYHLYVGLFVPLHFSSAGPFLSWKNCCSVLLKKLLVRYFRVWFKMYYVSCIVGKSVGKGKLLISVMLWAQLYPFMNIFDIWHETSSCCICMSTTRKPEGELQFASKLGSNWDTCMLAEYILSLRTCGFGGFLRGSGWRGHCGGWLLSKINENTRTLLSWSFLYNCIWQKLSPVKAWCFQTSQVSSISVTGVGRALLSIFTMF